MIHATRLLLVVVCAMALSVHALGARGQSRARVTVSNLIDSMLPTEETLGERVQTVDAVLLVKVAGNGVPRLVQPRDANLTPLVVTDYSLEVVEAIKPHPAAGVAGSTIKVVQAGGEADWGTDYRIVTRSLPHMFVAGETFLVFLQVNRQQALTVSSTDVYAVSGDHVSANALSKLPRYAPELTGQTLRQGIDAMRAAAARAPRQ